jgi:glycosyltransferase involved in cell wall biosynthesis
MSKLLPLFSVVIPTYNCLPFLRKAIQSVLLQTEQNFEILIIDNTSEDGTKEYLNGLKDSRIHSFEVQNYGVIAFSRNVGIKNAKGSWVCFLDADDWWTSDKLQACFDCINDKVDLIYHGLNIVSDTSLIFKRKTINSWQVKTPVFKDLILKGNAIPNSSVVIRKSLLEKIGGINESKKMIAAEDYNTWLRVAQLTNNFVYLRSRHGYYLSHNEGVSKQDMSIPYKESISEFMDSLSCQNRDIVESNAAFISGKYHYHEKEYKTALKILLKSLVSGKSGLKFRAFLLLIQGISELFKTYYAFVKGRWP